MDFLAVVATPSSIKLIRNRLSLCSLNSSLSFFSVPSCCLAAFDSWIILFLQRTLSISCLRHEGVRESDEEGVKRRRVMYELSVELRRGMVATHFNFATFLGLTAPQTRERVMRKKQSCMEYKTESMRYYWYI